MKEVKCDRIRSGCCAHLLKRFSSVFSFLLLFWRAASSENKSRKNCDYRKQTSLNKQGGVKRLLILVFIDSNALTVCFPAKLICEFQVVSTVTRHPPPRWNYRGEMFVTVKHRERVINILSLKHGAIPRQLLYLWTNGCFGCFSSGYEVLWQMAHLLSVTHWLVAALTFSCFTNETRLNTSWCELTTSSSRLLLTADW